MEQVVLQILRTVYYWHSWTTVNLPNYDFSFSALILESKNIPEYTIDFKIIIDDMQCGLLLLLPNAKL